MLTLNEAWNRRDISNTSSDDLIKVTVTQTIIGCVEECVQILSSALETLSDSDALRTELFVVSRYLHRRKAQIRRHKTRQVLSQVQSCLKRLEELNMAALITRTHQQFVQARRSQQTGAVVYLPSRGLLKQVIVRLIGGAALLVQTVNYCVNATLVLQTDVKLAHLLPSTMMCLAAIARIWACSRSLYLDCLYWYSALLPQLKVLPRGKVWLSEEEDFPQDLNHWLDSRLDMENISRSPVSCDEAVSRVPPPVTLSSPGDSGPDLTPPPHRAGEDIGAPVTISREALGIQCNSAATRQKKNKTISLEDITIETESSSDEEPSSNPCRTFPKKNMSNESNESCKSLSLIKNRQKPGLTGNMITKKSKERAIQGMIIETDSASDKETTSKTNRNGSRQDQKLDSESSSSEGSPRVQRDQTHGSESSSSEGAPRVQRDQIHGSESSSSEGAPRVQRDQIHGSESSSSEGAPRVQRDQIHDSESSSSEGAPRVQRDQTHGSESSSSEETQRHFTGVKRKQAETSKDASTTKKLKLCVSNEDEKSKSTVMLISAKDTRSDLSNKGKKHQSSEMNFKTHESRPVKCEETSPSGEGSNSSKDACNNEVVVNSSNKKIKPLPQSKINVKTKESRPAIFVETSPTADMSSSSTDASNAERSKDLSASEVKVKRVGSRSVELRPVKREETFVALKQSSSSEEQTNQPVDEMEASTNLDSKERNVDSSTDQSSSESDEEQVIPNQPPAGDMIPKNTELKRLKNEINSSTDVQGIVDIFFSLKPEETNDRLPCDPWPLVNMQKKKELFDKKIQSIETCIRKTPKRKVLQKLKTHCFSYMKEVQVLTKQGTTEVMTRDALTRYVEQLKDGKLTWHGKTVSLPPKRAKIIKLDLESLMRKMTKVKSDVKRLALLQKKAGNILVRCMQIY